MTRATSIQEYIDSLEKQLPADLKVPIGTHMRYVNDDGQATNYFVLAKVEKYKAKVIDRDTGCGASMHISLNEDLVTVKELHNQLSVAPYKVELEIPIQGDSNLQVLYDRTNMLPGGTHTFNYGDKFTWDSYKYVLSHAMNHAFMINIETGRTICGNTLIRRLNHQLDLEDIKMLLKNNPDMYPEVYHLHKV